MVSSADLQTIVDITFVLFISGISVVSLLRSGQERSAESLTELQTVEAALRGLIVEASAASSSLDESLLRRKRELEELVRKIEELTGEGGVKDRGEKRTRRGDVTPRTIAHRTNESDSDRVEEFPNETWIMSRREPSHSPSSERGDSVSLRGQERDPLVRKARPSRAESANANEGQRKERALSKEIEGNSTVTTNDQGEGLPAISPAIDTVAFRIAKRLLKSGREIHVVARKLDLPVAHVRAIDALLQHEALAAEGDQQALLNLFDTVETERVSEGKGVFQLRARQQMAEGFNPSLSIQVLERRREGAVGAR